MNWNGLSEKGGGIVAGEIMKCEHPIAGEKIEEKERTSMDRLLASLGAKGLDATLIEMCASCPLYEECKKSSSKCRANAVILFMAMEAANSGIPRIESIAFLKRLQRAAEKTKTG
jgi:hypothetical protein